MYISPSKCAAELFTLSGYHDCRPRGENQSSQISFQKLVNSGPIRIKPLLSKITCKACLKVKTQKTNLSKSCVHTD